MRHKGRRVDRAYDHALAFLVVSAHEAMERLAAAGKVVRRVKRLKVRHVEVMGDALKLGRHDNRHVRARSAIIIERAHTTARRLSERLKGERLTDEPVEMEEEELIDVLLLREVTAKLALHLARDRVLLARDDRFEQDRDGEVDIIRAHRRT